MLDDGTYDAIVVDAAAVEADDGDDAGGPGATVSIELTIVAGPAKGEVVTVLGRHVRGDPIDLLGVPATLTVTDGTPALRLEP